MIRYSIDENGDLTRVFGENILWVTCVYNRKAECSASCAAWRHAPGVIIRCKEVPYIETNEIKDEYGWLKYITGQETKNG